jgi:hypothetical protein
MPIYELTRFIHVAAAVALLGGSVMGSPAVRAAVRRARTAQEIRTCLAVGRPLMVLEPAAAFAVLATGIYLTNTGGFWSLGWVQVALAFWVVNAVVAGALVKPALGRVAQRAATAGESPVDQALNALRWSPRWSVGGNLLMANDAAMLYLMTMQPGLAGSLLTVAGANLLVAMATAVGHAFHPPAAVARPA